MIKSPLRYPGGKSRAVKFLSGFIPPFNEFREVFFGGGSLSFYLLQQYPDKKFIASDLNYELYCFWQQLKENKNDVVHGVQHIYDLHKAEKGNKSGKNLFNQLVARRNDDLTEVQRAIDFFVLNRITFSGVVDSGGFSQGSFEGRFTQSAIDRLTKTSALIQSIDFCCEDYQHLVKKNGEDVFLFLDPPYYTATKSKLYGKKGILHTQFDHEAMFETLKNSKHKWLITYDNSDFIRELYREFYQLPWQLQYGMTTKKTDANELLIANYQLSNGKT